MKRFFKPNLYETSIYDINLEKLKELGIKGFIFDVDNTIVPYDTPVPDEKVKEWFKKIKEMGFVSYIASNNNKCRVEHFAKDLGIGFMPKANKPLTKNLKQICKNMGISVQETAMVGDQLFTDMLGGNMAGMFTVLIEQISPVEGKFIKFKRIFEKMILPKKRRMKGIIC